MSGALAGRSAENEASRGRVETTKVRRYFPGKRPDWIQEEEDSVLTVGDVTKSQPARRPETDRSGTGDWGRPVFCVFMGNVALDASFEVLVAVNGNYMSNWLGDIHCGAGIAAPVVVARADPRLQRLQRAQQAAEDDDIMEGRPRRRHEIAEPQVSFLYVQPGEVTPLFVGARLLMIVQP